MAVRKRPAWRGLGAQILLAMVLGVLLGVLAPSVALRCKILGDIFLRLIRTAIAPLVFVCVVAGIVAAGDVRRVGKLGLVAVAYFELVSTVALGASLLLGVGSGTALPPPAARSPADAGALPGVAGFVLNICPDNFVGALTRGELLQVLVIALVFGAGVLRLSGAKRGLMEGGLSLASDALFEFIHVVMILAPVGTFGAIAFAVAASGTAVLLSLAYLVVCFYAVAVLFIVVVLGAVAPWPG